MLIVAGTFALAATPTFLWLKERAVSVPRRPGEHSSPSVSNASPHPGRQHAISRPISLPDGTDGLLLWHQHVVVLAAVYAQEVMGFRTNDIIVLVMVVNVTAAVGAFLFGRVQDRLGSLPTLAITL
jgi:UMF1 family MFS transporter